MNILDILVVAIMLICIIIGASRGFIKTILGFANFILAIILTNMLYPHMGRFLRSINGLYNALSTSISQSLNLDYEVMQASSTIQNDIINMLPLPQFFRDTLIENNNPIVYNALGVINFTDFISHFLASIVINIISMVFVFILVFIGLNILTHILNLLSKLPVLNSMNKFLGGILGAAWGLLITWIVLGIVVIYFSANGNADMIYLLYESHIASRINETNFALAFILRLFP